MTKFKNEYILFFVIIVFMIYYFMGRSGNRCSNGFRISAQPDPFPNISRRLNDEYNELANRE